MVYYENQLIKKAADTLRQSSPNKLKASHAYELIAAAFNYQSYAAMRADPNFSLDPDEPENFDFFKSKIRDRLKRLNGVEYEPWFPDECLDIIKANTTPPCSYTGEEGTITYPVNSEDGSPGGTWVSDKAIQAGEFVGKCIVCGELYDIEDLNKNGECPIHEGETDLSPTERDDWNDYLENINKP
nr:hypothetical protein [uncultured Desulfobacter sp.]